MKVFYCKHFNSVQKIANSSCLTTNFNISTFNNFINHFSKNRQFKVEEKDENGDVIGQYGYYDDKGKLIVVKYSSTSDAGFKIL